MPEAREPNVKDQSETGELSQKMLDFINELRTKVRDFDIDGTETWRAKMQTARNQRQGIKRVTNIPWPGAPDIPIPETDKIIRKHKPNFVLSAISGKTVMSVNAAGGVPDKDQALKDKVRKAGLAMNHLFTKKIPWVKRLTLASDHFLEKGHVNFKIIEKFSSRKVSHALNLETDFTEQQLAEFKTLSREEQELFLTQRFGLSQEFDDDQEVIDQILREFNSGKKVIRFDTQEVSSLPDVVVPLPEKVFVPRGTTDISKAERITHEFFIQEHVLVQWALDGVYDKTKVFKALENRAALMKGDDEINEKLKDRLTGVTDKEAAAELIRIHEIETWVQEEDGKPFKKMVFSFLADVANDDEALVQKIDFPFSELDGWNWERHDNEVVDDNHYRSRGVPEQIRALQEFLERSVNNTLIRDEINNAPMFTVLNTSKLRDNNLRFIPGQRIPVSTHEEIRPLIEGRNVDVSSERITQLLKAFAEEYVGNADQLFRNATNKGGGKTLGEVERGLQLTSFLLNLDVMNWLDTLGRVYTKVFLIMRERLVTPIVINGEEITREDFQFEPDIRSNGSIEEADRNLQAQKSLARVQLVQNWLQFGIATQDDLFNAATDYLEKDGVTDPDKLLTDPKQILQEKITQLNQQAQQLNGLIQQQSQVLEEGEKALDRTQEELKGGREATTGT